MTGTEPEAAVQATAAPPATKAGVRLPVPRMSPPPGWHKIGERIVILLALLSIASILLVFVFVAREALPLFTNAKIHDEVSPARMLFAQLWPGYDAPAHIWQPVSDVPKYGVFPLFLGTAKITLLAIALALPLGLAAAVYVSQYASARTREIVKPSVELLAGIPSVVLGFFALIVLATAMQNLFGFEMRLNAAVAGVALCLATIPIVFTISEEALGAVPHSYVEASLALGARRWQTVLRVIVPAALPGIFAAGALGVGRAFGETMIVLMASGNASIVSLALGDSARTIPATIASELAEVVFGDAHYTVLFALGTALLATTALINFAGDRMISRLRTRMGVA